MLALYGFTLSAVLVSWHPDGISLLALPLIGLCALLRAQDVRIQTVSAELAGETGVWGDAGG